jgi:hypothetical protein
MKRDRKLIPPVEPEVGAYQVAEHFNVNEGTVRRWQHEGMPAKKYNARFIRYKLSEVEKWLLTRGKELQARGKKSVA